MRFLSCEPLLGPVNLDQWLPSIDWVICGGESGPGSRPMDPDWAHDLLGDCARESVPFFFKQWGDWSPEGCRVGKKHAGRTLGGATWSQLPE